MSSGTSYNGWAANSDPNAIGINSGFSVDGMKFPGGIKGGDVATVFTHLIRDLVKLDPPNSKEYNVEGFWGYSYRANTNNPSTLSCHASGTAIDWRAVAHPNKAGTRYIGYSDSQVNKIQALLSSKYRDSVQWLPYDSMHFEIKGSSIQINALAKILSDSDSDSDSGGGDDDMPLSEDDLNKIADKVFEKFKSSKVCNVVKVADDGKETSEMLDLFSTAASGTTNARRNNFNIKKLLKK